MRPMMFLAAALTAAALPAGAQTRFGEGQPLSRDQGQARQIAGGGEFWTDPRTGCSYARAHVRGYAPTWHLIVNGAVMGLTNARPGCPTVLRAGG